MKLVPFIAGCLAVFIMPSCGTAPVEEQQEKPQEAETPLETEVDRTMTKLEEEHLLFREGYADSVNQGLIKDETFKGSSRREATGTVGDANITVNYGSPGKRGRVIWNGLVSYDQIWVTGSHWATAVTFDKNVRIEGTDLPAGTYAFFTIPGREEWTLVLNKTYDQHLADDYSEADDVVRVKVKPQMQEKITERLTYSVEPLEGNRGQLSMAWDDIKVSMPFEVL